MKRRLLVSYLSLTAFVLLVARAPARRDVRQLGRAPAHERHPARRVRARDRAQESIDIVATNSVAPRGQLQQLAADYHRETGRTGRDRRQRRARSSPTPTSGQRIGRRPRLRGRARDHAARSRGRDERHRVVGQARRGSSTSPSRSGRTGVHGAVRITYPASLVDDRIQHIWFLLAATGGVVLGSSSSSACCSPARSRGPSASSSGRRRSWVPATCGARRRAEGPGRADGSPSRSTPPRRVSSRSSARSRRSSPTPRTSCVRRWPRCGSGSRTSRPT